MTQPTYLYRHFAADGALLYVGISLSWPARTKQHAGGAQWFAQVAQVTIEQFPTREAALDAEREAIKREKPQFNVVHNRPERHTTPKRKSAEPQSFGDWVKVGRSLYKPGPRCSRCSVQMGCTRWHNLKTNDYLCSHCFGQWRRSVDRPDEKRAPPPFPFLANVVHHISGPHAIVGPALMYREDQIGVLVAFGDVGTHGELTEVVLGTWFGEIPEWADGCDSVITIRRPNDITMAEARELRLDLIRDLKLRLPSVEAYDTDIALAVAYASQFPSEKSRQVLNDVAKEVRR